MTRAVTYKDHAITHLQFSPHKERLGFFYYPYDNSVTDIALAVMDISLGTVRDIYQDSVRTSRWEWKDDGYAIVYYNCGNECLYARVINVDTGEEIEGYHVY